MSLKRVGDESEDHHDDKESVAAVAIATIGIASAPVASAYPITGKLGGQFNDG